MCQQPNLSEADLIACLRSSYDLPVDSVRFLPIGYDLDAFVYEASTAAGISYFVKVRSGPIPLSSLLVPRTLIDAGIPNILAPIKTRTQALWHSMGHYSVTVYPFLRGENAMIIGLSESQWKEFGHTLQAIHSGGFAELLKGQVREETFALPSALLVRRLSQRIQGHSWDSSVASDLARFWSEHQSRIDHLLDRATMLGNTLQSRRFDFVLCHADIHAANILVSDSGHIYLVDWDGPLLAPRERDLLFVVGSKIARTVQPHEEAWFFEGYGKANIDWTALAYYRYERVIEDIGEFGRSVLDRPDLSEEARAEEAEMLRRQFLPGSMIESALEADQRQRL